MTWKLFLLCVAIYGLLSRHYCLAQKLKPTLTSDASVVLLDEAQKSGMTLTHLQCHDPEGGVATVSADNVSPNNPCGKCFSIVPCQKEWCLDFTPFEALDMTKANSYTVNVRCAAQNKQIVKDTVQVRLFRSTKPPEFGSFPKVVVLEETETQEVILQKVTCTDPDKSQVKVDLTVDPKVNKAGCSKCFSLEPCGNEWCLKFIPGVGTISFSVFPIYPMTLTCTDDEGKAVTSDIEVRVTKNSPPHFEKLYASSTIVGTSNVKAGAILHRVNATDDEGDSLFYTLKTNPAVDQLAIGFTDGVIVATGDLSQVCSPIVSCEVFVNDGFNPEVGPMVVDLTLNDANTAPSVTNMDETVQIPEDLGVGSAVYKINILDEDSIGDMTLTLKANPPQAQSHFQLKDNEIVLQSPLDYEDSSLRTVQLTLSVTDSGGCASPSKQLTVSVTDINEPPEVVNDKISVSVYEGMINVRPQWSVEDEDFVDIKKYRITGGNDDGRFAIDSTTGVITSLVEYDVDRGKMPRSVTLTVEVEDKGGLTSEGEVTLKIKDANDQAPFIVGGSRAFTVTECTIPGTSIIELETKDYDSYFQFNKRTHFLPMRNGPVSLLYSGEVVLTSQMAAGDTAFLEAFAMDAGKYPGPLKSTSPVYITVRCVPCPTTTTMSPPTQGTTSLQHDFHGVTTTIDYVTPLAIETKDSFGLDDSLWWLVLAGLLAMTFLALLGWMCWKVRCCQTAGGCNWFSRKPAKSNKLPKLSKVRPHTPQEKKETKINVQPPKPPTPPPQSKPPNLAPVLDLPPPETPEPFVVGSNDGNVYDFWKEKYNEEDYTQPPDRNSKPQPAQDALNPLDHPTTGADDVTKVGGKGSAKDNPCIVS